MVGRTLDGSSGQGDGRGASDAAVVLNEVGSLSGPCDLRESGMQLPINLQQLIVDCFEEGHYEQGIETLHGLISPTIIPTRLLFQLLIILLACQPSKSPKRSMRLKGRQHDRDSLPTDVPVQAVEAVSTLLHQYVGYCRFAGSLLASLPQPSTSTADSPASRRLASRPSIRDRDSDDEQSVLEGNIATLMERTSSVWDLLRAVVRQSKQHIASPQWDLPGQTLSRSRARVQSNGASNTYPPPLLLGSEAATGPWNALRGIARDSAHVDAELIDDWRDVLARLQSYQSERCWKLLDLFTRAWQTEQAAYMDTLEERLSQLPPGERFQVFYSHFHLLGQLSAPRAAPTSAAALELNDVLDAVFAGLYRPEAWVSVPLRVRKTDLAYRLRAECAARLYAQLGQLARIGAIEREALVRGTAHRLFAVSLSDLKAFKYVLRSDVYSSDIVKVASRRFLRLPEDGEAHGVQQGCRAHRASAQRHLLARLLQRCSSPTQEPLRSAEQVDGIDLPTAFEDAMDAYALAHRTELLVWPMSTSAGMDPRTPSAAVSEEYHAVLGSLLTKRGEVAPGIPASVVNGAAHASSLAQATPAAADTHMAEQPRAGPSSPASPPPLASASPPLSPTSPPRKSGRDRKRTKRLGLQSLPVARLKPGSSPTKGSALSTSAGAGAGGRGSASPTKGGSNTGASASAGTSASARAAAEPRRNDGDPVPAMITGTAPEVATAPAATTATATATATAADTGPTLIHWLNEERVSYLSAVQAWTEVWKAQRGGVSVGAV